MQYIFLPDLCKVALESEGFQQLKNYPDDFKVDLIIYDYTWGPCLLGYLPKFKYPPLIGVSAYSNPPYTPDTMGMGYDRIGLTSKPYISVGFDRDMNFLARLYNGFLTFYDSL